MNIDALNVAHKRVLVRVDFNVPLDSNFDVTDATRIVNALPTIKALINMNARVILLSHLGRPEKKRLPDGSLDVHQFTLRHLIKPLSRLLGQQVQFSEDCVGLKAIESSKKLKDGEVLLCENTRFHAGETAGDEDLAKEMAKLGDLYVNDAFGTAHRAHASTAVISKFFGRGQKSFGYLMENEIKNGNRVLLDSEKPVVAILGGAKVSDKIELVSNLISKAQYICIGGGMAYTFYKALGGEVGTSLVEDDKLDLARKLLDHAKENGCEIILPVDSLCAAKFDAAETGVVMPSAGIKQGWMGLDIGPEAVRRFAEVIKSARTILWNGPMGVFEFENFSKGTFAVAEAVALSTQGGCYSLIGGGDSVAAIQQSGLADQVSFISTGGGAMLEFLEGKVLPGIAAIEDSH